MRNRTIAWLAFVLALAEVVLVVASWVANVLLPDSGVRSLLSGEGIRWFIAQFTHGLLSPVPLWIIVWSMAVGCASNSGIGQAIVRKHRPLLYRERAALCFALTIVIVFVIAMTLLTVPPQAVLLNATGGLVPSPFSLAIVPATALCLCAASVVYGFTAGSLQSLTSIYLSLIRGMQKGAPLLLLYILLIQIYYSLTFVFGQNPNY